MRRLRCCGARAARHRARRLPEMRVEITTPPTSDQVSLAISPDGEKLVFVASSDGRPKLWLRSLRTGSAQPLPGTEGASFPFWSPDSRSIAFFANGNLNRIDIDGSSLRTLASAPVGAGGTWNREGTILYTLVPDAPISRIPADGGKSAITLGSQPGGPGHRFPQFLPDGRHFLYYVADSPLEACTQELWMAPRDDGCLMRTPPLCSFPRRGSSLFALERCSRSASIPYGKNWRGTLLRWHKASASMRWAPLPSPVPRRVPSSIESVKPIASDNSCGSIAPAIRSASRRLQMRQRP